MRSIKFILILLQLTAAGVANSHNLGEFLSVAKKKTAPEKEFKGPVKSVDELELSKNDTISRTYREFDINGNLILEKKYSKGLLIQKEVYTQRGDTTQKETFFYTENPLAPGNRVISLSTKTTPVISNTWFDKNDSIVDYFRFDFDTFGNIISRMSKDKNTYYKNKYDDQNRLTETRVCSETDSLISITNIWYGDYYRIRKDSNAYKTTYSKFITDTGASLLTEYKTHSKYDEYTSFNKEAYYKWDANNRLVSFSGNLNGLYCQGKCFYNKDQMVKVEVTDSASNKSYIRYKYDKKGRIVEESYKSDNPRYEYTQIKKYDKNDRLILDKANDNGSLKIVTFNYDDKKKNMEEKVSDKKVTTLLWIYDIDKYGNWTKKYNSETDTKTYIRNISYHIY